MDEMLIRGVLKSLLMPPLFNILLIFVALSLLRRWRMLRFFTLSFALLSLLLLSTPIVANFLASQLERYPALSWEDINAADYQAIIVLSAGRSRQAAEYGGVDIPKNLGLERLRYGAYLQGKTGLPIMTTGGAWLHDSESEAALMARVLERDFKGIAKWRENRSRTTWENALYSKQLADQHGIKRALLVTHAWHMSRAVYSFQQAGLDVTPAPTIFTSIDLPCARFSHFVPSMNALHTSTYMLHELLGVLWYRFTAA
jgi:uncharacterized SAM-binding protein YcdF (DUF218 family)